ncbi:MAG TPA: polysaccharide deacetylase family protein, partial [Fimbriimonas sp.]|nr:polysaccharide deacetylase family protein [Fimbriimonas sp.]
MRQLLFGLFAILTLGLLAGCSPKDDVPSSGTSQPVEEPVIAVNYHGDPPTYPNICMDAQNRRIPIIMFHDLVYERSRDTLWYDCSLDEFKAIIDAIDLEGMTVISLDELYDHLTTGKEIPTDSIVLTFDDNYQSFYDLAWPILKEKGYPAAMFVHTAFVGKTEGRPKMSWDTLKELAADPLMTIGGHTINHFLDLKDRDINVQRDELTISKTELETQLNITIDYLAYPNGSNGMDTQHLAEEAGYKMAFTIEQMPAEESPNIFAV